MKLQLVLATALLAISATSVQAADTRTPDILDSVFAGDLQDLSRTEVKSVRGEYLVTGGSFLPHLDLKTYEVNKPNYSLLFTYYLGGAKYYVAR